MKTSLLIGIFTLSLRVAKSLGSAGLMILCLGTVALGCKRTASSTMFSTGTADVCLLTQAINTLEIHVTVNDPTSYHDYNFEFSEVRQISEADDGVVHSSFAIPFMTSNQQRDIPAGSDGISIIGNHLARDLTVKDKFQYFAADLTTPCRPLADWQNPAIWPPQDPTITVLVNERALFESTFEVASSQTTDQTEGCNEDQLAKKIILTKIEDLSTNPSFAKRLSECSDLAEDMALAADNALDQVPAEQQVTSPDEQTETSTEPSDDSNLVPAEE